MLEHSEPPKSSMTLGPSPVTVKLLSRRILPDAAMLLVVVSCVAAAWLALEVIASARLDLALAKWVYLFALSAVIGHNWGGPRTSRRPEQTVTTKISLVRRESGRGADTQERVLAALLISGAYVLIGYSLHFAGHYGPWYNGLVGTQGLLLLMLAAVGFLSRMEQESEGQGFSRLIVMLSLLGLLSMSALDLVPYMGS